jgi:hypothetical protein
MTSALSSLIKHRLPGGASLLHPTAQNTRGGGPGLAALLLPQILSVFSVVAPCQGSPTRQPRWGTQPGAALRDLCHDPRRQDTSARPIDTHSYLVCSNCV